MMIGKGPGNNKVGCSPAKKKRKRTWFKGNPGSPGMEKLLSRAMF